MSSTPFIIESTSFPEIIVLANPDFNASSGPAIDAPVSSTLGIQPIGESDTHYHAELRVKLDTKKYPNAPYHIEIVCMCFLRLQDVIPVESRKELASKIAHSITFPAIREMILTLTARQPWGQFNIGFSGLDSTQKKQSAKSTPAAAEGKSKAASKKAPTTAAVKRKVTLKPKVKA